MFNKKGQIWVETIIYTLIAFVMIGLVLFFAGPQIGKAQDKAIVEQSVTIMQDIDSLISSIGVPGNKRLIELEIDKGTLKIDGTNNKLIFEIQSEYIYSQPDENISQGVITVNTDQKGDFSIVLLSLDYAGVYNITYEYKEELKSLGKSSTPYKLFISNKGGDPTNINFEIG